MAVLQEAGIVGRAAAQAATARVTAAEQLIVEGMETLSRAESAFAAGYQLLPALPRVLSFRRHLEASCTLHAAWSQSRNIASVVSFCRASTSWRSTWQECRRTDSTYERRAPALGRRRCAHVQGAMQFDFSRGSGPTKASTSELYKARVRAWLCGSRLLTLAATAMWLP